ncbi:MAG: transcription termination/antitermination protein NusG [Acidimicrobiia bacterium]|nr:transcription termination/antitermination protein NusG [Acidimicrobiia bacterium]MDH5519972.1 transcription termination/antitermination protein NusG [Acidimicrobiia bacterium]
MSDITETTPAVEADDAAAESIDASVDGAETVDASADVPVGEAVVEPAVSVTDITAGSADEEANQIEDPEAAADVEGATDVEDTDGSDSGESETEGEESTEAEAEEGSRRRRRDSPYDRPGRWFVIHTQSGYENKVRSNLLARTQSMNMEERIFEVVIPMEDVVEFKNGKKVIVQKKVFPGYLLTRMHLDDDSWFVVRNTPGVTGFIGAGNKPSPLPRKDVENFLAVKEDGDDSARKGRPRLEYTMGETVRVKEGPFADFQGEIVEINEDQLRLKVLVNIFGRETPVELQFAEVAKI